MAYTTIDWRLDDGLLWITLNRPESLNAFTRVMANELVSAFRRAAGDDAVRVILVTGAGRAFCAGMDLSGGGNAFALDESMEPSLGDLEMHLNDPAIEAGVRDTGGLVSLAIYECPKPVIGVINGAAVGVGATMTLPMDFRLASTNARIGFVFGRIGIVPEACSSWFLPRLVGLQQALEWIYTAEVITAEAAKEAKLVRSIHAPDTLLKDAEIFARKLVDGKSPVALGLARQMLYRNSAAPHPLDAHRIESLAVFYTSRVDGQEGVKAFLEKRTPEFRGKASDMPPFYAEWIGRTKA